MNFISRWRSIILLAALAILLVFSISMLGWASAANATPYPPARTSSGTAPANTAVLTYKNSTLHTGSNQNETILTPNNVNSAQFGKLVSYPVDGQVYAQPLYMPGLSINGTTHNVVFVATENNTLYAFDADQVGFSIPPLWKTHFGSPVPYTTVSCTDMIPTIGITGTPVIDTTTNTLYVVSYTTGLIYKLHAIDMVTGQEKAGSPTTISGIASFNTLYERQRSALLLANGKIYMSFSSFCDNQPAGGTYHGFIISYTYNGSAFAQADVWNDTVNGFEGGIWGGAGTLVADGNGNIYAMTGNGTFNADTGGNNYGNSFVKLDANLQVTDYFTPFNQDCLATADRDLGSGGPLLVQGSNYTELIGAGKEGRIYVVDANNMGHYHSVPNACSNQSASADTNVKQELPPGSVRGVFNTSTTWSNDTTQYVYVGGVNDHIKAFQLNSDGTLVTPVTSQTPETFGFTGANTFISSNGTSNGIVWATDRSGFLRAYDATNLTHELFNGGLGSSYVKFGNPVVANGEVFVGAGSTLDIFGLLPPSYAAASSTNTIGSPARVASCSVCVGGKKVGFLGKGGTLQFNNINVNAAGTYVMTMSYIDGDAGRAAQLSINGGAALTLRFHGNNNNNWNQLQTTLVNVQLNAGANTLKFFNASAYGPDINFIAISPQGNATVNYYQATSAANTIGSPAVFASCSTCSSGQKIGFLGKGGTLQFNNVYVSTSGSYTLTIAYIDGDAGRSLQMSINGGAATTLNFHGTNDRNWNNVQVMTITVQLNAGYNTIKFFNASAYGPDIDFIAA